MDTIQNNDISITKLYKISFPTGYESRILDCLRDFFKVLKIKDGDFTFLRLELKKEEDQQL